MIERLADKNDLKKYDADPRVREIISDILQADDYVELVQDKHIFLGCRPKKGTEILQVEDEDLVKFFRHIRDNYEDWLKLIKIKKSAHKQFLNHLQATNFFQIISKRYEKNVLIDSQKITGKIHSIREKIALLHERLQGVFIIAATKKEVVCSVDDKNCLIVSKIVSFENKQDYAWLKEARYAKVMVFTSEEMIASKVMKQFGYQKLQAGRKKCKNIWVKNHK
jgi:hypothetical protein